MNSSSARSRSGPTPISARPGVIEENVVIGEGAELRDLTSIGANTHAGAWEIWDGSPGTKVGIVDQAALDPQAEASTPRRMAMNVLYTLMLLAIPPLGLLPIIPAFWVFDKVDDLIGIADVDRMLYMASIPIMAWPTAFVMVLVTVGFMAAFRWIVLPRVTEGTYSIHSWFYLRKWAVALASEITLETLSSLYADDLYAGLVSADGRQDRQGRRDFDRAIRPL